MAQRALASPWHGYRWSPQWALAVLAVVTANILWGSTIVAGKVVVEDVPPMTLSLVCSVVKLGVLLPLVYRAGGRPFLGGSAATLGLTRALLFLICYNLGLQYTSATNASLILNGGELVVVGLLAAIVLGERLTGRWMVGGAAALVGMTGVILFGHGGLANLGFSAVGDGLMLASVTGWAIFIVVGRRVFGGGSGLLTLVAGSALYGTLILIPFAAVELVVVGVSTPALSDLLLILYLGAVCSAPADLLLGYGLRRLEAGQVAILGNLSLLTSVAGAALVLHEPIGLAQLAGGALILAGICYATVERRQTAIPASPVAPARRPALAARLRRHRLDRREQRALP